jgi:effector-binding domain-containing protein
MTSAAVHVREVEPAPVAVVRRQVPRSALAEVVPQCCGLVWEAVRSQRARAGRHVAIYWDGSIRLDVGVELEGPFSDDGEVVVAATPGGLVATTTHTGPYSGLEAGHDAVRRWCAANGHRLAGPSWEIYGHWQREWDADPSAIRTEICYLLVTTGLA